MNLSRRKMLQLAATTAAAQSGILSSLPLLAQSAPPAHPMAGIGDMHQDHAPSFNPSAEPSRPWLHPEKLQRFVDRLPLPQPIESKGTRPHPHLPGKQVPYYRIAMREVKTKSHRDLPPTSVWAYGPNPSENAVPGPTIETRSGQPILIEWVNELPKEHFLPIDHTLCGAGKDLPLVRTAVHVHGGNVPPESDGYPENWQTYGQSMTAFYPMEQEAATLWYHDHAMGIERLNQYAGLFGFFLIRDEAEDALQLPSGKYEIPLAICDRFFYADGGLHYPDSGDPEAPWVQEVYGDVILANGVISPYVEVEPRLYRFRVVNSSNSRGYALTLSNNHHFHQIGTDQGLLPAPVELKELNLFPAERADLLIDFSTLAGQQFILQDHHLPILQFRVSGTPSQTSTVEAHQPSPKPATVPGMPALLRHIERIPSSASVRTRIFTLNEYMHPKTHVMLMLLNGQYWHDPVTEKPVLDSVEIWSFRNLTQDIHPIHLHLVRFQILDRRPFDVDDFLNYKKFNYVGDAGPPPQNEMGWKDTVQTYPETETRIIVPFKGYTGRYVWHCHLLEHAANEMMRPFEVIPSQGS